MNTPLIEKWGIQGYTIFSYSLQFFLSFSFNPYVTNEFSHHYQLDESNFTFRGVMGDFFIFISFFDEISLYKQDSPRWDAAFCDVTSGAMLFAYVPFKGRQAYMYMG